MPLWRAGNTIQHQLLKLPLTIAGPEARQPYETSG